MGEIHKINGHTIKDGHAHKRIDEKADKHHKHDEYLTEHQDLSAYATKDEVEKEYPKIGHVHEQYALKEDLENHTHSEYIKEQDLSHLATKEELMVHKHDEYALIDHKHNEYLTEHQSLDHLATKEMIKETERLIDQKISELVDSAPEAMDTLRELAESIGQNRNIYDQYIQSMTEMINCKAEKDHEHNYAPLEHFHSQYLTEHQDISHLATKEQLNENIERLENMMGENLKYKFINDIPYFFDGENWRNSNGELYNPNIENKDCILEYTIEPFSNTESVLYNYSDTGSRYRYFPRIYKTSDISYSPVDTGDITLVLNDGTETNNLEIYASDISKIKIKYNRNVYSIIFDAAGAGYDTYSHGIKELLTIDTTKFKSMERMFNYCKKLISISSNLDTSSVTTMKKMFNNCILLDDISTEQWNTENVTDMESMFQSCESLKNIDLTNLNVQNVKTMEKMFSGCNSLNNLGNISNWNTINLATMEYMFDGCSNLTIIDLSNWSNDNLYNINYAFRDCSSVTEINLHNWVLAKPTKFLDIFKGCKSTKILDISNWVNATPTSYSGGLFTQFADDCVIYVTRKNKTFLTIFETKVVPKAVFTYID